MGHKNYKNNINILCACTMLQIGPRQASQKVATYGLDITSGEQGPAPDMHILTFLFLVASMLH